MALLLSVVSPLVGVVLGFLSGYFLFLDLVFVLVGFFVGWAVDNWQRVDNFLLAIDHFNDLDFAWITIDIVLGWAIFQNVVNFLAKIHKIFLAILRYLQRWLTWYVSLNDWLTYHDLAERHRGW